MLSKIKQLTSETATYGISTILGRFLNFILVPFYTNVLKPSVYGVVTTVYAYIAFLNVIYTFGLEAAYFKYASTLEIGNKKENFSTPLISIFCTSLLFTIILLSFSQEISNIATGGNSVIVKYTAGILFFDALCVIPFATLRLEKKAKRFAFIKLFNIVINVTLNLLLLLVFHMDIEGIFISALVASISTFILLLPTIISNFEFCFPKNLYKELLLFGLPYIPSALSVIIIQVVDRPILEKMLNYEVVGIFQANYRLGIVMMLVVSMFEYAWRPFFLTNAKEENAKEIFARVLTYFTIFACFVFLLVSFFISEIVQIPLPGRGHIIGQQYWGGLNIVPIILLSYIFNGFYTNFIVGVYIEKKTKYLPYLTGLSAISNIAFNLILIPYFQMIGAACATLISYMVMAGGMYLLNQKFYPIKYEYKRLAIIAISTMLFFLIFLLIHGHFSVLVEVIIKLLLISAFISSFFYTKFFYNSELDQIKLLLGKLAFRIRH
jgi:O-antigen/teichoic acid export membrane protein